MANRPEITIDNIKRGLKNPEKAYSALYKFVYSYYAAFTTNNYKDYYLKTTKRDVYEDPEGAVGPGSLFAEMRGWQMTFLKDQGLHQSDYLLDVGCGVLRGGIPLIEYLETGNYYGMDISSDALEVGRQEISKHNLNQKDPTLINNENLKFNEPEFNDVDFDIIWLQSVFTHLPQDEVAEFFEHVPKILSEESSIIATYWEADGGSVNRVRGVDFYYPFEKMQTIAAENDFDISRVPSDHPNDLDVLEFMLH